MSIAAPATNPASDLELKLPATIGTAGQYLKNSSTPGTLEFGGGGKILQVVTDKATTGTSTSSESFVDTELSAAIQPASTSNHVLVMVSGQVKWQGSNAKKGGGIQVLRDSTAIQTAASDSSGRLHTYFFENNTVEAVWHWHWYHMSVLDSPSSTSSLTYKVQIAVVEADNSGVFGFGTAGSGSGSTSQLTLMEIAG